MVCFLEAGSHNSLLIPGRSMSWWRMVGCCHHHWGGVVAIRCCMDQVPCPKRLEKRNHHHHPHHCPTSNDDWEGKPSRHRFPLTTRFSLYSSILVVMIKTRPVNPTFTTDIPLKRENTLPVHHVEPMVPCWSHPSSTSSLSRVPG
jgi:hypothetical protein